MRYFALLLLVAPGLGCQPRIDKPANIGVDEAKPAPVVVVESPKIEMTPVSAVAPEKLIALLPAAPMGFTAQDARGESISANDAKYSHAERKYTKGYKTLLVVIQDRAHIAPLYAGFGSTAKLNRRDDVGHEIGLDVDGYPAIEKHKIATQWSELSVLVSRRHVVIIQAEGMDPDFVHAVYKGVDVKALAALQ